MTVVFVKKTKRSVQQVRIPRKAIGDFLKASLSELKRRKVVNARSLSEGEIRLVFIESKEMKRVNGQFRKKAKVTDVLSFLESRTPLVGEIVFCVPRVQLQAKNNSWAVLREYQYLALHGLLHLLGYDHEQGALQAREMFRLQDSVFSKITGIALAG